MVDEHTGQEPGERQAERFDRLVLPYLPMILRTARYMTHHDQDAEDLAQETLLKTMRSMESFTDGTDIRAWLLSILRHTHIDRVRGARHRERLVPLEDLDLEASPQEQTGRHDASWPAPSSLLERFSDQEMIDKLKQLPEEIRWTLLLVDVEQMDHAAAAQVLDVPVGTVKSRIHRGHGMLRDMLFDWAKQKGWIQQGRASHA